MAPEHPVHQRPHRTLLALGLPVLGSLVAEPLTGLVDTAFVARLGAAPLAALGVGTIVLSASLPPSLNAGPGISRFRRASM